MSAVHRSAWERFRPAVEEHVGLVVGGLVGACGGLYLAAVGAIIGFMVDRVRGSFARPDARRREPIAEAESGGREADRASEDAVDGADLMSRTRAREILGLDSAAGPAEIRHAFRRVSKECHPDAGDPSDEATRRFLEAREAYERLTRRDRISRSPGE